MAKSIEESLINDIMKGANDEREGNMDAKSKYITGMRFNA